MCILQRTLHYQMSQRGWLPETPLSSSFPSRSSMSTPSPFLPSTSVLTAKKRGESSTNCLGPRRGGTPPSLSLSPLSSSLLLSSPCCDRAHLLDLGYTRSESNYLAVSSPRLDFLGVELTSPLVALIPPRTGRGILSASPTTSPLCPLTVVSFMHSSPSFLHVLWTCWQMLFPQLRDPGTRNVRSNLHTAL